MKKFTICILSVFVMSFYACKNQNQENEESTAETTQVQNENKKEVIELGEFPFLPINDVYVSQNKPLIEEEDELYFPINNDMIPVKGRTWKANMIAANKWNLEEYYKFFESHIKNLGGELIFDSNLTKKQLKKYEELADYKGEDGSMDYWNEAVKLYKIQQENKAIVYVQISGNSAAGKIQILEEAK